MGVGCYPRRIPPAPIVSIQVPMYEDAKVWLKEKGNILEDDF